jgi:hypothetical protein
MQIAKKFAWQTSLAKIKFYFWSISSLEFTSIVVQNFFDNKFVKRLLRSSNTLLAKSIYIFQLNWFIVVLFV